MIRKLIRRFTDWRASRNGRQYDAGYKLSMKYCKTKSRNAQISGNPTKREPHHQLWQEVEKIDLGGMYGAGFKQAIMDFNDSL